MPRFFIDTSDGDLSLRDDDGYDLPNVHAARDAAIDALPDMARDKLPDGERRAFTVVVRSEDGQPLYSAALSFAGDWQVTPQPS